MIFNIHGVGEWGSGAGAFLSTNNYKMLVQVQVKGILIWP